MFSKDARGMAIVDLITGGSTARALSWKGRPHGYRQGGDLRDTGGHQHFILRHREFNELPRHHPADRAIAARQPCQRPVHAEPTGRLRRIVERAAEPPTWPVGAHHIVQRIDSDVIGSLSHDQRSLGGVLEVDLFRTGSREEHASEVSHVPAPFVWGVEGKVADSERHRRDDMFRDHVGA